MRKNFGKLKRIIEVPNLIDIQKRSYDKFLQRDTPLESREDIGLQAVFKSVFPIKDFGETSSLEFVSYSLDRPKYDEDECRARGMTFAAPIKVVVRLVVWDVDDETGTQSIRDVKEQEVYFGEIPLMTETRYVHHQRNRARRRLPAAPLARASSSTTTRARPTPRQASSCTPHALSPTAARGSTSSSTRRTSSTSASTAAARCTRPFCCVRSAAARRSCSTTSTRHRDGPPRGRAAPSLASRSMYELLVKASAPRATSATPETGETVVKKNTQVHQGRTSRSMQAAGINRLPDADSEEPRRARSAAYDIFDKKTGEVILELQRGDQRGRTSAKLREAGIELPSRSSSSTASTSAPTCATPPRRTRSHAR